MTRRVIRRLILWGFISIALLMSILTPWPTDLLARPITANEAPLQPADAIIVLGSGTRRGADPLPTQARLRTDQAIALWKQGLADTVIFSGGVSKTTGLVESDVMAQYAVTAGLSDAAILRERRSTSTRENAQEVQKILTEKKFDTAIVVTSSYHTWRACKVFRFFNMTIQCAAATIHTAPERFYDRFVNLRSVIREYGAIMYYITRQYI